MEVILLSTDATTSEARQEIDSVVGANSNRVSGGSREDEASPQTRLATRSSGKLKYIYAVVNIHVWAKNMQNNETLQLTGKEYKQANLAPQSFISMSTSQ